MKPLNNPQKYVDIANKQSGNDVRKNFLSHISHGIRTPLNSIMGFSRLLMDRQMIDGKPKEYAQRIIYSSNVLLGFVESVIELSQFESNAYELKIQKFNLNDLLWTIAENFMVKRNDLGMEEISLEVIGMFNGTAAKFLINTDYKLLKNSINRLINIAAFTIKSGKIELGFEQVFSNKVTIYVQSTDDCIMNNPNDQQIDENDVNTFQSFNYEVLNQSVNMIGGRVCIDPLINQYSIEMPINKIITRKV
ncbi:MAG: histidine kinase dimerization/phospho-acceptor domain-containing protein [Bacteroidales bacterium]|jgi:signal transduction histidine kinase|nr:histidine kinase dimerization/phospho-acceptor domain-containing protein [Bacteroidales bacterium]